jgi:hypothetical protein
MKMAVQVTRDLKKIYIDFEGLRCPGPSWELDCQAISQPRKAILERERKYGGDG